MKLPKYEKRGYFERYFFGDGIGYCCGYRDGYAIGCRYKYNFGFSYGCGYGYYPWFVIISK